ISERPRGVLGPQAFPLPTSLSRFYAHLSAFRMVTLSLRRPGAGERAGPNSALVVTACVAQRRAHARDRGSVSEIPWFFPCFSLIYRARARGRVLRRERPRKPALARPGPRPPCYSPRTRGGGYPPSRGASPGRHSIPRPVRVLESMSPGEPTQSER